MSTTPATPGPYSGTCLPATTPVARPPGLAEAFTDAQLQAAIDAAFPEGLKHPLRGSGYASTPDWFPSAFPKEAPCRLAIARAFLAALPKPAEASAEPEKAKGIPLSEAMGMPPGSFQAHLIDTEEKEHAEDREQQEHIKAVRAKADDGPAWIPHDGGPCPLKDEEAEEWEHKLRCGTVTKSKLHPSQFRSYWRHDKAANDIIAYRVLKWKPGQGPQATSKADEPAQAEAKPTHEELLAEAMKHPGVADVERIYGGGQPTESPQAWTPQPGDVVRLKSGGPEMTVESVDSDNDACCSWHDHTGFNRVFLPVACLTPAKEGQP